MNDVMLTPQSLFYACLITFGTLAVVSIAVDYITRRK